MVGRTHVVCISVAPVTVCPSAHPGICVWVIAARTDEAANLSHRNSWARRIRCRRRARVANANSSRLAQLKFGVLMTRQLPSLNGLRAFEAAGRHGSFKAAAEELNVTQTAVSHMVRLLEEHLGFALFRRHANRLELTDQGRAFQPGLTDAFDAIARLAEQVASMRAGPVLTVGVAPALALRWLIPRLASFNRNHPHIEVRVPTGGAMLPDRKSV